MWPFSLTMSLIWNTICLKGLQHAFDFWIYWQIGRLWKGIANEHNVLKERANIGTGKCWAAYKATQWRLRVRVVDRWPKNGPPSSNSICFTNHPSHNTTIPVTIPQYQHNTSTVASWNTQVIAKAKETQNPIGTLNTEKSSTVYKISMWQCL